MTRYEGVVPPELDAERADRILAVLVGLSRSEARSLVADGSAVFDGVGVKPSDRVQAGTAVATDLPEPLPPMVPEDVAFGVLYEDEFIAVVDKPAGLTTHPGAGRREGTLAAGLLHRWPRVRGVGQEDRWGIVHRLDHDTSGLLVVGLTVESHAALSTMIRRRAVERTYLAVVHGVPSTPTGTIDAPLGRDTRNPTRYRVVRDGRAARTHFSVEQELDAMALLKVTLETGRTHQIRVHLASIGHPVAGDRAYGRPDDMARLWLHARRLRFDHPITGAAIDIVSPLPQSLATTLASGAAED